MTDSFDKVEYATRLQDSWTPNYPAIYNLFLGPNSNAVNETTKDDIEQASVSFKTVETLGEVAAKPISEQSTEISRFKTGSKTKSYLKYLNGIAWKRKGLRATYENFASISNQALNKILMQEDKEFLTGLDANGNQTNNGLFISNDPDYVEEKVSGATPTSLTSIKNTLDKDLELIRKEVVGVKYIFAWGTMKDSLGGFPTEQSIRTTQDIIESSIPDVRFINPISDISAGASSSDIGVGGYLIVTPSAVRLHHGLLTKILSLGYNEEEMRIWLNIGYNSKSLEVLAKMGIYKKVWNG